MENVIRRPHRLHPGFPLASFWRGFSHFFEIVNCSIEAQSAYTHMAIHSDEELARKGIKREDIPQIIAKKYF